MKYEDDKCIGKSTLTYEKISKLNFIQKKDKKVITLNKKISFQQTVL